MKNPLKNGIEFKVGSGIYISNFWYFPKLFYWQFCFQNGRHLASEDNSETFPTSTKELSGPPPISIPALSSLGRQRRRRISMAFPWPFKSFLHPDRFETWFLDRCYRISDREINLEFKQKSL